MKLVTMDCGCTCTMGGHSAGVKLENLLVYPCPEHDHFALFQAHKEIVRTAQNVNPDQFQHEEIWDHLSDLTEDGFKFRSIKRMLGD